MILIGSAAIKYNFPDFTRIPNDLDYIGNGVNSKLNKKEYHVNPIFENYKYDVMKPNDLYTLKISHIFWDIKWEKHMYDIQFLKEKGCVLNMELFNKLYNYWNNIHGLNKRSDLSKESTEFFNNALKKYDHDKLHLLLNNPPTYLKVLKDGKTVDVCEQKFNKLSFEEKLDLVREEVYVMAYERLNYRNYRIAYAWMLKKFILHHAPVFEALFIVQNFKTLHKPLINYKNKIDYELSRIS